MPINVYATTDYEIYVNGEQFTSEKTTITVDTKPANTDTKSPQTGDSSSIVLWIAVLFVSGFGVVATAVYGKKRKSSK